MRVVNYRFNSAKVSGRKKKWKQTFLEGGGALSEIMQGTRKRCLLMNGAIRGLVNNINSISFYI